ncbi:amidohydrolase family protein [Henriciella litoralis]|uniref:amidohydrolase family protein n=1 Tax=Henriciella litoralis TaxID=568102 RepID=UPI00146B4339|nr:amidohydrolase family protein [Henriciella litoralis]
MPGLQNWRAISLTVTVLLTANFAASAQDVLIRDAKVFDVTSGDVRTLDVLAEDGRFTKIEESIEAAPEGVKVIDADGKALLPGLIDVHTHWTGMNGATRASIAVDLLEAGVTTATDFHSSPEAFEDMRAYHAGIVSPHVFYAARMSVPYGHGTAWTDERVTKTVFSAREADAAVEDILAFKPDAIKVFADGWRYGSGANLSSINLDAFSAIVGVAHEAGLPVFSHTVTVEGGKQAARAGVDGIVHALQDRTADEELVELMTENGVYYSPTLTVYEPFEDEMAEMGPAKAAIVMRRQQFSRANMSAFLDAGVKVAMGTDQGIDNNPFGEADLREMELMVDFGLTPSEALTAATLHSAELLGLSDDRGSIEVGKRADFILVAGEPWKDISELRSLDRVFLDGREVVADAKLSVDQGAVMPDARPAGRMIDDFENDALTSTGACRGYDVDRNHPRSRLVRNTVERIEGGMALHVSADLTLKEDPFAFVVLPLSPAGFLPVDAARFDGVRLDVRGQGPIKMKIGGGPSEAESAFETTKNWKTVELPFEGFAGEPEAGPVDLAALHWLSIGRHDEPGTDFWFELDNVEFYKSAE